MYVDTKKATFLKIKKIKKPRSTRAPVGPQLVLAGRGVEGGDGQAGVQPRAVPIDVRPAALRWEVAGRVAGTRQSTHCH